VPLLALSQGRRLHYEDYGRGPLLVLLHGSPGTGKAWQRAGERLSDRFRIVAPDLPGHGASDPVAGALPEIFQVAADIEALIGAVGVPLVLAGHSHGGNVALSVGVRRRAPIGGLALFEAVAVPVLRSTGDGETFAAAKAVFDDYVAAHEAGADRAVARMVDFWFGQGAFERMPAAAQEYLVRETGRNVLDVRATLGEEYSLEAIRGLDMPLLSVHGSASPIVTAKIAGALATHSRRGTLAVIEGATHGLTTTHAEAVARLIATHADRCASASAQ